jgi:hypothetical protein
VGRLLAAALFLLGSCALAPDAVTISGERGSSSTDSDGTLTGGGQLHRVTTRDMSDRGDSRAVGLALTWSLTSRRQAEAQEALNDRMDILTAAIIGRAPTATESAEAAVPEGAEKEPSVADVLKEEWTKVAAGFAALLGIVGEWLRRRTATQATSGEIA